jgi:hypothetical protein
MTDRDTADEIAQIEHELEILRSHQALVARWERVTKVFLAVVLPGIPILLAVLVYTSSSDVGFGIYLLAMAAFVVAAIGLVMWRLGRSRRLPRPGHLPRDFPAHMIPDRRKPSGFYPLGRVGVVGADFFSFGWNEKSEAETIRDMIALREQRLAELKRSKSSR